MGTEIHIHGLSKAEQIDLQNALADFVRFEVTTRDPAKHGEPATATAIIAVAAIGALAAYLTKKRSNVRFHKRVTVKKADGSTRSEVIDFEIDKESTDAEVVKQLNSGLGLDRL